MNKTSLLTFNTPAFQKKKVTNVVNIVLFF